MEMEKKIKEGEAKNYSEAEKIIDMENSIEQEKKSLLISLEELIPGIKPESEIKVGINDRSGRELNDEYANELFSEDGLVDSYFDGYFLRKENSQQLDIISKALESCKDKEQWQEIQKKKDLNRDAIFAVRGEDTAGFVFSQFKDQIVVDLGCGYHARGYDFISLAGAKGYVGVDMYHGNNFVEGNGFYSDERNKSIQKIAERKHIVDASAASASFSADDMLTFLKRLPDNSVSIFISGIDANVLDGNFRYIDEINREIQRVLNDKGAFVSYQSCFHPKELNNEMTKLDLSFLGLDLYKKPKQKNDQ
ncbi:MAG: hypothetical protein M0P97_03735 [Candidatus Moranbacteria bacterium]|nr:hypothetical protein [Candidatus Moranbacteria bacterium]